MTSLGVQILSTVPKIDSTLHFHVTIRHLGVGWLWNRRNSSMTPASQTQFLPITQGQLLEGNTKMVEQCLSSPFLERILQEPKHSVIV